MRRSRARPITVGRMIRLLARCEVRLPWAKPSLLRPLAGPTMILRPLVRPARDDYFWESHRRYARRGGPFALKGLRPMIGSLLRLSILK